MCRMDINVKGKFRKIMLLKIRYPEWTRGRNFNISTETIILIVLDTFINGKLVQDIEMDTQEYFHLELL
jgi:hypothetical protein